MNQVVKYDWIEPTSWALIAGVAWLAMQSYGKPPSVLTYKSPSAECEVDPNRWKHNGAQPVAWKSGNRPLISDDYTRASIFSLIK